VRAEAASSSAGVGNTASRSHDAAHSLKRSEPFQFGSRLLTAADDVFEWNAWDHVDPRQDRRFMDYARQQYAFQKENGCSAFDRKKFDVRPERWWDRFYGNNAQRFFKDRKWLTQEFRVLGRCLAVECEEGVTQRGEDGVVTPAAQERTGQAPGSGPVEEAEAQISSKILMDAADAQGSFNTILEIGAGAGNTAFPLLRANKNPDLLIHACDFSHKAVHLIRSQEEYASSGGKLRAEVWDMAATGTAGGSGGQENTGSGGSSVAGQEAVLILGEPSLPDGVLPGSVDVVLLIFAFSALNPRQWAQAVRNVWAALRPGGEVCFRDYGRGDLAQVRFKRGRYLADNFYVRGDGTRVYFFEEEELRKIWDGRLRQALPEFGEEIVEEGASGPADSVPAHTGDGSKDILESPNFEILALAADRRLLVNRSSKLKMYRCWMQGRFRKPLNAPA